MNRSEVMEVMRRAGKSSIPFIQNKLKISYNEAIKLIDEYSKHNPDYQTLVNKD